MNADSESRVPPLATSDFELLDLNKIKPEPSEEGLEGYIRPLVAKEAELKQAGKTRSAAAAQIILDICGYGFTPSNSVQPYSPRMVLGGKRTAMPEDIPPELAAILAEI